MRLIDGDELLMAFPVDDEPMLTKSCVRMTIRRMPTVDAVEVVRCKDCKWYGYYSCEMGGNNWMRDGNGFCDRGVRKDDDHEEAD